MGERRNHYHTLRRWQNGLKYAVRSPLAAENGGFIFQIADARRNNERCRDDRFSGFQDTRS